MYAVHKAQHVVETEEVPAAVRSDESVADGGLVSIHVFVYFLYV